MENRIEIPYERIRDTHGKARLRNVLENNNIFYVDQLKKLTPNDFLKFRNSGKKTLEHLITFMKIINISFSPDSHSIAILNEKIRLRETINDLDKLSRKISDITLHLKNIEKNLFNIEEEKNERGTT